MTQTTSKLIKFSRSSCAVQQLSSTYLEPLVAPAAELYTLFISLSSRWKLSTANVQVGKKRSCSFCLNGVLILCLGVNVSVSLAGQGMLANEKSKGMGDQEEGMDLADEIDMGGKVRSRVTSESCGIPRVALGSVGVRIG